MFGTDEDNNKPDAQQSTAPSNGTQDDIVVPEPEELTSDLPEIQHTDGSQAPASQSSMDPPPLQTTPPVSSDDSDAASTSSQVQQEEPSTDGDDLSSLKKEALSQLGPLVDHLDQSNEEKFRITMMLLQATDDRSLVKKAYEAAKSIEDEKVRAQALLDVVNEINYFTQTDEK